ncbi:replication initiation protein RepC [Rhizobium leguminosarum]|uniref:Replication initiation protein RepC n=1 Tax=Rhizobium leguminosarum TaxID=384 RepID=A0AAJ1A7U1_RHILE|nr:MULTISPECIES: plasmid replication protein RepC [Rhizobium]MBY3048139.1 replication initiation protein RepC [Rhizobium laguerreae]MBY5533382.1 replication initiation protein RepC [Rhizobium leguminosarum]MBY5595898.1 replication initiation protein RepC [Rhizobium leguminosarum]MBY5628827.1 replication initiation protein RepC [Rhizobium leguminosarum]MBY5719852.1 replication initiation protein RepC [Rhizobium leguminosarum]
MESGYVTTPFGRRPMSLGMLASQQLAETIEPGMKRSKWKLFRAICEARPALGVTDRALTVLDALLTFYPDDEISEEKGLIVFPSNAQLSLRARGMTPATLRRHLAVLVEAGLILRKDSPNGKRYARRDRAGAIGEAFGFSVAPLLARAVEIESLAAQAVADRELLRVTRERLTVCRRDISKLIEAALEEGVSGNWEGISAMFRALLARIPRVATAEDLAPLLDEMGLLRAEIVNMLERRIKAKKIDANESQIEHHKQNSNPDSLYELEPSFETKQGEKAAADNEPNAGPSDERRLKQQKPSGGMSNRAGGAADPGAGPGLKSFPLGLVLQACPSILDYGPGGSIGNWRDLMSAAVVVRSMLGVSPSAYEEACSGMGPENAATVIACILERGGHINSPGGYLRDLTRRTERGEFAIGPMLMALVRTNGPTVRHAS